MSKSQNTSRGNKIRQGNMTPQKVNNHTIEDLVESEGDEFPVAEVRRMFNEFKEELKENI
jgi:hypothetical protein